MNKVLVLGVTGMLGNYFFKEISNDISFDVIGTSRWDRKNLSKYFSEKQVSKIKIGIDADNLDAIDNIFEEFKPKWVINCIGLIKQQKDATNPILAIKLNSLFPHLIHEMCEKHNAKLIHVSTDCVFNGKKGTYVEKDISDAEDLYGRTKYLGEVNYGNALTLRTSIIGHELNSAYGLVEWFLTQNKEANGFTKAMYSGITVNELTDIIKNIVFKNDKLVGLIQVSSSPISKYDLLMLINEVYKMNIVVKPYADFVLDRTLNSDLFKKLTGYSPPSWRQMIERMYLDYKNKNKNIN